MSKASENPQVIGFGLLLAALMFALIFFFALISLIAIPFAAFGYWVANRRYRRIGSIAGFTTFFVLGPAIVSVGEMLSKGGNDQFINFTVLIGVIASPAYGFIISCIVLDFLNDQRDQPTWNDDFIAWRRRYGFTKGLDETEQNCDQAQLSQPHSSHSFDVPPQDD